MRGYVDACMDMCVDALMCVCDVLVFVMLSILNKICI